MYLSDEGEKFLGFEVYDCDFFLPFQSVKRANQVQKKVHVEKLSRNVQRFQAGIEEETQEA